MEQDKQKLIDSFLAEKAASIANAKKLLKILRLQKQSNIIQQSTTS
jgi:lipoprotein Spr